MAAMGLSGKQFAVIVHGYVLGQYGLLWALENDGGPLGLGCGRLHACNAREAHSGSRLPRHTAPIGPQALARLHGAFQCCLVRSISSCRLIAASWLLTPCLQTTWPSWSS